MLPKNTFRQRRLDRLKIYPTEAPESAMGNVQKTWREETGGDAFRDIDAALPETSEAGQTAEKEIRA